MSVGAGIYQGATPQSIAPLLSAVKLYLVHLNPGCAVAIRKANPLSAIGLRADLGNDGQQVNFSGDPRTEAATFWRTRIGPQLGAVPIGTYSFAVGINEAWPSKDDKAALKWRAQFELALCEILQKGLELPYAWGSIPVGNLEAADVPLFADVFREAWAVNYHGYLGPGRTTLLQEGDIYYLRRPEKIWWAELQKLGIPLRLLLGECGTFTDPSSYPDFGVAKEAALAVAIARDTAMVPSYGYYTFYGACCFGIGTVGTMAPWDLTSALSVLVDAGKSDPQPSPIVIPTTPPKPTSKPGGKPVDFTSPNHDGPRTTTLGCVVHATLGGTSSPQAEFDATVNWFNNSASQVSAHAVIGPAHQVWRPVRPELVAWHCRQSNSNWRGLELCKAHVTDALLPEIEDDAAKVIAQWWKDDQAAGIHWPLAWSTTSGLAEHREMPTNTDGHQDVGGPFDRAAFLAKVRQYAGVDELTDQQKKAVLDDLDFIYAYARVENITKNPAEAQKVIQERAIALKTTLGLNG